MSGRPEEGGVDSSGARTGLILGIESSCDETAAAVVLGGVKTLSNVVASQSAMHAVFGGVVPEIASREHLRLIVPVVREALVQAGVGFGSLSAVAVTEGPGLAGALLVGLMYAKGLAFGLGVPLIGVNHLEGHIQAVLMEAGKEPDGAFCGHGPLVALVVSGGHTHLYRAAQDGGVWRYRGVGRTVDDAAGEAFDKVAKVLGLPYPGGPWMDRLARSGDAEAVKFGFGPIRNRAEKLGGSDAIRLDFSFSGIKTAVARYVEMHPALAAGIAARRAAGEVELQEMLGLCDAETLGLIASFQAAVVGVLMRQTFAAVERLGARGVVVSGGVSANGELRRRFAEEGAVRGIEVRFPGVGMSTDNAAMIAAAGWGKFSSGAWARDELVARPGLRLGEENA